LKKVNEFIIKNKVILLAILAAALPFIVYLMTLERKLIGGDTAVYALQVTEMSIMVPTGYPVFSMLEKLFTFIPIGDVAYRLNFFSAVFGALTILFLFLSINRLVKNAFVSFVSSMIFAFMIPFWEIANRLEFDTLQTFFIALLFFSALLYDENKNRKYLYFFSFCLGLSLTNHPLVFFLVPAVVLYVIIINPTIFKNAKAIFISILYFILPLMSYLYLPIRSLQGYGTLYTPLKLLLYVTGRYATGEVHGGSFGDKDISIIIKVIKDYLGMIHETYGILLLVVALIGFIILIRKNIRFALCTFLLVIVNIVFPPLYAGHALRNYLLYSMIVFSFYIASGLLFILNGIILLFKKSLKGRKELRIDKILKYLTVAATGLFFIFIPCGLVIENYPFLDHSETSYVYKFWDEAFGNMESNSRVYVLAKSTYVGMFVNKYEYGDKNIEYISHKVHEYSARNMMDALDMGTTVYFVGNEEVLNTMFEAEQVGITYIWDRYDEKLRLYRAAGAIANIPEISYHTDSHTREFGEEFTVEYIIKNEDKGSVKITSLELELPGSIKFIETVPCGCVEQGPGLSQGIYMWVSDSYIIESGGEMNLIVKLKGTEPGKSLIKFRLTTGGFYVDCDDIEIEIKE